MTISDVILTFIAVSFFVLLAGFAYELSQSKADRELKRFLALTRFNPDGLGNKPSFFNPNTGQKYSPRPGNSPVAPLPGTSLPLSARANNPRPLVINTGGMKVSNYQPEMLNQGENEAKQLNPGVSSAETFQDFTDFSDLLRMLKQEGRGKRQSILEVTGAKAGGNDAYRVYSELWDSL